MKKFLKLLKYLIPLAVVYFIGWIFYALNLFGSILWLDSALHLIGGLVVGYVCFSILKIYEADGTLRLNRFFRILFVISLVALVVILWEFYEFVLGFLTNIIVQPSLNDTLTDLLLGLVGGIISSIFLEIN